MRGEVHKMHAHVPNCRDLLAHFIGIGALKLTELGVALDFEKHLFSLCAHYLDNHKKGGVYIRSCLSVSSPRKLTLTLIGALGSSVLTASSGA